MSTIMTSLLVFIIVLLTVIIVEHLCRRFIKSGALKFNLFLLVEISVKNLLIEVETILFELFLLDFNLSGNSGWFLGILTLKGTIVNLANFVGDQLLFICVSFHHLLLVLSF